MPQTSRFQTTRSNGRLASPRRDRRRGVALLVVFLVVSMLGLAGMHFVNLLSIENQGTHYVGKELQAKSLLGSGEAAIGAVLTCTPQQRATFGGIVDNPDRFQGTVVLGRDEERLGRSSGVRGRFSVVSPQIEEERFDGVRFGLENESARLNLAALPEWERRKPGAARTALMALPEMTESTAEAILDWIDADSTARTSGAEADHYKGQDLPYAPRNGVPGCLEELLLVKGVTREALLGVDANANFLIDPNESDSDGGGSSGGGETNLLPWGSLLTLYSAERNVDSRGQAKIHLNQKDLKKLHQQLKKSFKKEEADFVVLYRQYGPETPQKPISGATKQITAKEAPRLDFSRKGKYQLRSVLDLLGGRVVVPRPNAPEKKPKTLLVASPWSNQPSKVRKALTKLHDQTTTTGAKRIVGRVNLDLAPRCVLAAVPGMDTMTLGQIVSSRAGQTKEKGSSSARFPTWLWTERIVSLAKMKELLPFLTCGGDVYRAQVVGFFDPEGPVARAEIVLDATLRPVRRVYWKELSLYGLGHDRERLGGQPPDDEDESGPSEKTAETSAESPP